MTEPHRTASRPQRLFLAAAVLLAVLAALWWSRHDGGLPEPPTAGAPAIPEAPVAPPAVDSIVPPPLVGQPPDGATPAAPRQPAAPGEQASGPEPPPDDTVSEAAVPPLLSDDTDLSHARRAGLHQAPNPLRLTASAVLVMDQASGEVLYERNPLAILPIASLTKLMTGIVVLDARLPLDQRIRIERADVDTLRNSRSRLRVGTTLTRRDALRIALMSSENRAAHALARTFPGGREAFVRAMNAKAAELGMEHTHFADPTGLSNANRATARDVGTLVMAAARYPLLRTYSTTPRRQVVVDGRGLRYLNSNRLVRGGQWSIQLQKTGYIVEAGQCLAMSTRVAGRQLVLVLLDAGSAVTRTQDAQAVRRWVTQQARERRTR